MKHLKLRVGALLAGSSFLLFAPASFGQAIPPVITSVTPNSAEPGTWVTIDGRGLENATAVLFNGVPSTIFSPNGIMGRPDQISALIPKDATSGPMTVVTLVGRAVSESNFTVRTPGAPEITSVYPVEALAAPNHFFTVEGKSLQHATEIRLGVTPLEFFGGAFPGTLMVQTPSVAISGQITVVTPYGTATSKEIVAAKLPSPPVITDFFPKSGPEDTEVTLIGTNLEFATKFKLGEIDLYSPSDPDIVRTGLLSWTVIMPTNLITAPIRVISPYGETVTSGVFMVTPPKAPDPSDSSLQPAILSFTPIDSAPGGSVLIRGINLRTTSEIQFNGVPSPEIAHAPFLGSNDPRMLNSNSYLRAIVPTNASSGPITVVCRWSTATSALPFRVSSDISLQVDQLPLFLAPGEPGSFTLTLTNRGFAEVRGAVLKSRLAPAARITAVKTSNGTPAVADGEVTVTVPSLKAQSTEIVTITLEALPEGSVLIASEVLSNDIDPFPENNRQSGFVWTIDPGRRPPLVIDRQEAKLLRVVWPKFFSDYHLEFAASLNPPDGWSKVTQAPSVDGNRNVILLELSDVSDGGFFRLAQ